MNALALYGADPLLLERHVAVVPLEQALDCVERQPELGAPAKLAFCGFGDAELLVEISRGLDTHEAIACADVASERARMWLAGTRPETPSAAERAALEEALCELDWSIEPLANGAFRAGLSLGASPAALQVEAVAGGQVRVALDAMLPLRGAEPRTLARFALEANRRLRFARLSILGAEPGNTRAVWDAVMPGGPSIEAALSEAAAAVLCARTETLEGLRALRHASVRQAFERLRVRRS